MSNNKDEYNNEVCLKTSTPELSQPQLASLEKALGYVFEDKSILRTSLIHSSYSHENNMKCDNERMEFLGDAVLHLALTEYLLQEYPTDDEGGLSSLRSYCESESFLSERALDLGLGDYIAFGKGERQGGGNTKKSLLANTYEAVIAAVNLDSSYKKTRLVVINLLSKHVSEVRNSKIYLDSKSELQKYSQQKYNSLPLYEQLSETGLEHKKIFTVRVNINGDTADGCGTTKKDAEKEAAHKLFLKLTSKKG